jgi:hypothetical protein
MTFHIATAAMAIAAALALSPPAAASSNPVTCREAAVTVCQKQGHASLRAEPVPRAPSGSLFGSAWLPGYGRGHLPPLIALD